MKARLALSSASLALTSFAIPASAQAPADPEAQRIVQAALEKRNERWAAVDNYTLIQRMNGAEMTLYYEKIIVDGQPAFRHVPPGEYEGEEMRDAGLGGGMPGMGEGAGAGGAAGGAGLPGSGSGASTGRAGGAPPPGQPSPGGQPGATPGPPGMGPEMGPGTGMPPIPIPELPADLPLPEGVADIASRVSDVAGGLSSAKDRIPSTSDLPGAPSGGAGSALKQAASAGMGAASGQLQQKLMQKGMDGLMGMLTDDEANDGTSDARMEQMMFEYLGRRARLEGTEMIGGVECYILVADDISDLDLGQPKSGDGAFAFKSMTAWIDTEEYVSLRTKMSGEVEVDGDMMPIDFDLLRQDYRRVETMYEPFRRVISSTGMMDIMVESNPEMMKEMREAAKQLEDMEKQLAQMPPEQRRMVEQQMGPMLENFRRMAEGDVPDVNNMEMVIEVLDLLVNEGPPSMFGRADMVVEGDMDLEVPRLMATLGTGPHPEGDGELSAVQLVGGIEGENMVLLQVSFEGAFPESGTATGGGFVTVQWMDGSAAGFYSEEGATVTVLSKTTSRIRGEFSLEAAGEIERGGETVEAAVTVHGSFNAPVPAPPMGLPTGMPQRP